MTTEQMEKVTAMAARDPGSVAQAAAERADPADPIEAADMAAAMQRRTNAAIEARVATAELAALVASINDRLDKLEAVIREHGRLAADMIATMRGDAATAAAKASAASKAALRAAGD